jgi:hypothetical protein
MSKKLLFYDRYGVEEYYIYAPDRNELTVLLRGDEGLDIVENIESWISPRLGIRFELAEPELVLYHPNGERFSSYTQERQRADKLAAKLRELGVDVDLI